MVFARATRPGYQVVLSFNGAVISDQHPRDPEVLIVADSVREVLARKPRVGQFVIRHRSKPTGSR